MSTRRLVDPSLLPLLELMPGGGFSDEALPQIRAQSEQRFAFLGEPVLQPEVKLIDGPGGPLEIYWYDPSPGTTGRAALLHIHGGGMVIGSARSMHHGPAGMAAALGIPVASVEYRLAPEHPFPAPQDDCLAGLKWLSSNAEDLGVDPARIGIIGESAGGGLAAATALMARDLGGPALAAQFLVFPMLDHRTGSEACPYDNPTTGEFIWTRESNRFGWGALRGSYGIDDARKGWFSPTLADSLTGLPQTWIGTGSLDLFLDENLDYTRRLIAAGVPVELHVYPGAIHAFQAIADGPLAKAFNRDLHGAIARWLKE
ncbi:MULTISPECIES: alpha/beta hydrolase [unclassified Novosphingobium]|uniref:alpha/beta hydrolase n=1 Tax=unclassified Novosphingobium TaxID=2644732 RepID=UPI0025EC7DB3|nr:MULTISPECIES: alpha/beta hydrolase [unclassified Novosphingobium]HQV04935.1 alpha/beta hydrolase [Novosphingobium sp.]